jgi:YD repeat-containing protein
LEPGAFGAGWTHNFARRLIDSSGFGLLRPDGFHEPFNTVSSNRWLSTTGSGIVVTKSGSQYTAHLSDGSREIYDASGKLTTLVSSAGLATTLTYSGGELTTVTGPFGHTLELSYSDGLISVLADPDGNETAYSYDAEGNLAEVLYPDATTRTGSPPISRTPMKRATMPEEVFDGKAKTIYAGVQARSCCTDGGSGRHDAASRGGARPQSARLEPLAVSAAGRG